MTDVQVSLETGAGLERRLRIRVPASRVEQELDARFRSAARTVRLKGFRPGKVPDGVVRQRFGPQIRQEVIQDMVQSSYSEAIAREKLRPAGSPRIESEPEVPGEGIAYTAIFEVYPEFSVAGVDSMVVERAEVTVTEADIDQTIERLRRQRGQWQPAGRAAAAGDRVVVDFSGTLRGELVEGGKAERFAVVIGEGRMLAGFESGLIGTTEGTDKTFDVAFPDDYYEEKLRGQTVTFQVHVHEVTALELPAVDADFFRQFDVASGDLAEFRRLVRENLEREALAKVQAEMRRQLIEQLLAANPVDVPAVMVSREAASLQSEAARSVGAAQGQAGGAYDEVARRRVRVGLILSELVREQSIVADPVRIEQKLDDLCRSYDQPAEVRRLYQQNPDLMAQVENSVIEEQVMAWLMDKARITTRSVAFGQLMGV
ncbi:MAG: trigger factor [Gammaproteobacteria bacterium]|nr:trigger factor [Gammaproteobacteria bacterium]